MKFLTTTDNTLNTKTDLLVLSMFETKTAKGDLLDKIDQKLGKELKRILVKEEFKGKKGQTKVIPTLGKLKASYILLAGLGEEKKFNLDA